MTPEEAFGEKSIVILNHQPKGKIMIDEQEYTFTNKDGEYQFYNAEGVRFDYKSKGYQVYLITEIIEDLSSKDIEEYNRLAKKHKAYMEEHNNLICWKDETKRMQTIYHSMNEEQRANNEPWPFTGKHNGVDYEGGQIPPPPPPPPVPALDIVEMDQGFLDWRKANNRKDGFPSPIDYIDYYGSKMHYYIDDEKVEAKKAKALIQKQGAGGVEILPVDGVNALKIKTKA
jgi:hypothetical protein